jgi:hypothetical protein
MRATFRPVFDCQVAPCCARVEDDVVMHLSIVESQLRLRRDGFTPCPVEHLGAVMHVPVINTASSLIPQEPARSADVNARISAPFDPALDPKLASHFTLSALSPVNGKVAQSDVSLRPEVLRRSTMKNSHKSQQWAALRGLAGATC